MSIPSEMLHCGPNHSEENSYLIINFLTRGLAQFGLLQISPLVRCFAYTWEVRHGLAAWLAHAFPYFRKKLDPISTIKIW